MAIRRAKQSANYTVIPNAVFQDRNLKWRDLGLLVYLISKPADWKVSVAQIIKERDAARDAVRASIARLVDAGYIVAEEVRDSAGHYRGIDYVVFDAPQTDNPHPESDSPGPPNPGSDNSPPTKYRDIQSNDVNKTHGTSVATDGAERDSKPKKQNRYEYSSEFEATWREYPKREGGNPKKAAYKAWKARVSSGVSSDDLLASTQQYAEHCRVHGKLGTAYVKQASTFFGPDEHYAEHYSTSRPAQAQQPSGQRDPVMTGWY